MAPRANWKGTLQLGDVAVRVALYTAATTSERIAFHMVNRATGHRLRQESVDSETGQAVAKDDEAMGYELESGETLVLEPEDIAAAVPDSNKVLPIEAFLPCDEVDTLFLDRPYFLAPTDAASTEAFKVLQAGMAAQKVVAIARTVLFRRLRTLLIRPFGEGLIANTLNFDYQVQSAEKAFSDIRDIKIEGEMLDLAEHIIDTKRGDFDPTAFDDRYEAALADLVRAKMEGRPPPRRAPVREEKVVDLLAALRESAKAAKAPRRPAKTPRRKAG